MHTSNGDRRIDTLTREITTGKLSRRQVVKRGAALGLGATAIGGLLGPSAAGAQGKVKLTLLTHWGSKEQKDPMDKIIAEYTKANPNVTIEHQTVAFDQLLNRISTGQLGGESPDIYHFYNLWMPDFIGSNLLATPPADVTSNIKSGYSEGTVGGASYKGTAWGFPTEVDLYQLIYNKKLLQAAGVEKAPETWDEFKAAAEKLTVKDSAGKVTQAGFMLLPSWDSGVVHPFTSLLWSNGGQYVASDYSKALFNEQPGVETLQLQLDMIKAKSTILSTNLANDADFESGRAAMTIMANWWGATLRASKIGMENVGVAQIPHTAGHPPVALQYEWLWGVSQTSKNQDAAWKFLTWLNSPRSEGTSSPMGDFLTSALNAIPGRTSDQKAHADVLNDPFVKPFVDAAPTARSEPIIPGAQEIKTALEKQIEAAWYGQKGAADALNAAAKQADSILKEKG